ncbi:MAG: cellulase family glycosylhydrolase [Planctomycetes bacterium]|nr:cellulase family glycosylhydrolase [Planctomycetota bacterium]
MSCRQWLLLSLLVGACSEPASTNSSPVPKPPTTQNVNFGVTLAGAEFGSDNLGFCNENPGVLGEDYFHNKPWTYNWFADEGVDLFRIPFRWERIQPKLNGPLDEIEIGRLTKILEWANKKNVRIILDLHNFGRYSVTHNNKIISAVIDKKYDGKVLVSTAHLVDVWRKISAACDVAKMQPWALGLMNEPHDMGMGKWLKISQQLVRELRASEVSQTLLVAGDGWSSAENWKKLHGGKTWIDDPLNKIIYEAHVYFDHDGAGKYGLSFGEELRRDPKLYDRPQQRLQPFLDWLKKNNARGLIGEIGVPNSIKPWERVAREAMQLLQQHNVEMCYWAAGEWWGDYPLSIQPPSANSLGNGLFRSLKNN